jgi:GT2 family glycosyltransferase
MFEDYIALKYLAFDKGVRKPGGADLFTANVSMPKNLYLLVGGFDTSYKHGEDRELGLRLEVIAFAQFVYCAGARAYHNSATGKFSSFVSRAFNYGTYDYLMSLRYPSRKDLSPFQYLISDSLVMRLTIYTALQAPRLAAALCPLLVALAKFFSWLQWRVIAIALCKIIYKANYIQGLRLAMGSQDLISQLKLWKSTSH